MTIRKIISLVLSGALLLNTVQVFPFDSRGIVLPMNTSEPLMTSQALTLKYVLGFHRSAPAPALARETNALHVVQRVSEAADGLGHNILGDLASIIGLLQLRRMEEESDATPLETAFIQLANQIKEVGDVVRESSLDTVSQKTQEALNNVLEQLAPSSTVRTLATEYELSDSEKSLEVPASSWVAYLYARLVSFQKFLVTLDYSGRPESVDLNAFLGLIAQTLGIFKKEIYLDLCPARVYADPHHLAMVLRNLIRELIDVPQIKTITISSRLEAGAVVILIRGRGTHLAPLVDDRPFVSGGGKGLGLANARSAMEDSEGTLLLAVNTSDERARQLVLPASDVVRSRSPNEPLWTTGSLLVSALTVLNRTMSRSDHLFLALGCTLVVAMLATIALIKMRASWRSSVGAQVWKVVAVTIATALLSIGLVFMASTQMMFAGVRSPVALSLTVFTIMAMLGIESMILRPSIWNEMAQSPLTHAERWLIAVIIAGATVIGWKFAFDESAKMQLTFLPLIVLLAPLVGMIHLRGQGSQEASHVLALLRSDPLFGGLDDQQKKHSHQRSSRGQCLWEAADSGPHRLFSTTRAIGSRENFEEALARFWSFLTESLFLNISGFGWGWRVGPQRSLILNGRFVRRRRSPWPDAIWDFALTRFSS